MGSSAWISSFRLLRPEKLGPERRGTALEAQPMAPMVDCVREGAVFSFRFVSPSRFAVDT